MPNAPLVKFSKYVWNVFTLLKAHDILSSTWHQSHRQSNLILTERKARRLTKNFSTQARYHSLIQN
jgi:hypothetical protein